MPKRKVKINKSKARVLLSDILPYELPPSYNNLGLYQFFNDCKLHYRPDGIYANKIDFATHFYLSVIFEKVNDFPQDARPGVSYKIASGKCKYSHTSPFVFTVRHRDKGFRNLSVPHPSAQADIAHFYSSFAEMILYHTSKSRFSLRHPAKVARYSMVRDGVFENERGMEGGIEIEEVDYEWLRSYFSYKRYSNVYYFYDSKEYRELERKFGYLVKADIAKCFDSIYTHSIEWATHGKGVAKENLGARSMGSFGTQFDILMRGLNSNETSGITIGSEVSRIFAEIILQAIDVDLQRKLQRAGLKSDIDYKILRYVDDYFIFLADPAKQIVILDNLSECLRGYKLHLNTSKEEGKSTPWLSPLSVAKHQVGELLQEAAKTFLDSSNADEVPSAFAKANHLVTLYKGILIDTNVGHFDLSNYTLARCERMLEKIIRRAKYLLSRKDVPHSLASEISRSATLSILNFLEFMFFAYSGAPRMSQTVKLVRAASIALQYSKINNVPRHDREEIEDFIREEISAQLWRIRQTQRPDAVIATLVDCLTGLGEKFLLEERHIADVFGFSEKSDGSGFDCPDGMNSITLFSVLLHVRTFIQYARLREACENWVREIQQRKKSDGELAIVNLNILSCPYVTTRLKVDIVKRYGISDLGLANNIISRYSAWNVPWRRFDLYSTLQRKRMHDVY